jgi:hypothetical protein
MSPEKMPPVDIDMSLLLGASASSKQCMRIYIPNKDRFGNIIAADELETWVQLALDTFKKVNGGATAIKNLHGVWVDDDDPTVDLSEETILVYSFLKDSERFLERFDLILAFIKRFGRETDQKEVLVEFDDAAFWIKDFQI